MPDQTKTKPAQVNRHALVEKSASHELDKIVTGLADLFHDWQKVNLMPDEIELMVKGLDELFRKRKMTGMTQEEIDQMVKSLDAIFREKMRKDDLAKK